MSIMATTWSATNPAVHQRTSSGGSTFVTPSHVAFAAPPSRARLEARSRALSSVGRCRHHLLSLGTAPARAASAANTQVCLAMQTYQAETVAPKGQRLLVKNVQQQDCKDVIELLAETFAVSTGKVKYKRFLQHEIGGYIRARLSTPLNQSCCMVAYELQNSFNDCDTDCNDQVKTIVGVVEVSFTPETRSPFVTLQPPADKPYLCNMSVAEPLRRNGYGRLLLEEAEKVAIEQGGTEMWLHCRHRDKPATNLYLSAGYETVKEDLPGWGVLPGQDRRRLMKKVLQKKE